MKALLNRVVLVAMACGVMMLPTACVRSKPERDLPPAAEVFAQPRAHAEVSDTIVSTPTVPTQATMTATTEPTSGEAPGEPARPTNTPAAALTRVAATATAVAASTLASPTAQATAMQTLVPVTQTPSPANLRTYVVAEGDTLYSIAKRHGTTVAALQAVNSLDGSERIEIGQTLYLPADAGPDSGVAVKTTDYWVRQGENLSMIARRYKTTVAEIMAANPSLADEDQIYAGMRITVPVNTTPQRTHVVQRGESLTIIAARYGVSVRSIVQANGLRNANQIYSGQVLIIPD